MVNIIIMCIAIILGCFCDFANSEFRLSTDDNYSVIIAVRINESDNAIGKLEYSNAQFQMVTFNRMGETIYAEPYVFVIEDKIIVSKYVHQIKFRSPNDKYGGNLITGTIDFRKEGKPFVRFVNDSGLIYIGNITDKGKQLHKKYIPNIFLGY